MLKILIFLQLYAGDNQLKIYEVSPIEVSAKYPETFLTAKGTSYPVDSILLSTFSYDPYLTNLSYIPSITLNNYGYPGYLQTAFIRGFSSSRTGLYIEGFKLNSRSSGTFNLSLISGLPYSQIEVLSSAGSSIYGENALGGAINFKLSRKMGFKIRGGAGNLRTTVFSGSIGTPFSSIYYSDYTSIPPYKNKDAHLTRFVQFVEMGSFKSIFLYSRNNIGSPTSETARENDEIILAGIKFNIHGINIGYQYRKDLVDYIDEFFPSKSWSISNRIFGDFILPLNALKIRGGFEYEREYMKGKIFESQNIEPKDERFYPYFSVDFILGGFVPYFEGGKELKGAYKTESPFVYRTGFILFSQDGSLFFNYSKGFRAPTLLDLYYPNTGFTKGNPDLKSEISKEIEFGLKIKEKKSYLILSYFMRNLKDGITWAPDQNWIFTPFNVEKVKTRGIEGVLNLVMDEYILETNFIFYQERKREENGIAQILMLVPTYQVSFLIGKINPNFNFYYRARIIGPHFSYDPETFSKIEIKHVVLNDISLMFKLNPNLNINCIITNFDNKPYEFQKGYPLERRRIYVFAEANI